MPVLYLLLYTLFSSGQMIINQTYQTHVKMTPISYMIYLIVMGSVAALLFFIMSGCQFFGDSSLYLYSFIACIAVIINMLVSLLSLSYSSLASVTVSQNAGTLVLPIVYGVTILNESVNIYSVVGIIFIIIAFFISFIGDYTMDRDQKKSILAKCICIVLLFTSGMGSIIHKSFTISESIANNQTYLSWINIYMVPIIIIVLFMYKKIKENEFNIYAKQINKRRYLLVALGSAIGCLGMVFSMNAMMSMNFAIYSSLYSSMYIIFLVIISKCFFKEDIRKHHYIAVVFAIISVIFTSMA